MCGIVGFVNYKQDISIYKNILINMNNALSGVETNDKNYYIKKHVALSYDSTINKTRHGYTFL